MAVTRSQRAKPSQNEERRDSSSSEAAVTEDVEVTKSSATENEPPKKPEKAAVKESDHLRGGVDDPLFRDYAEGLIPKSDSKASASDLRMPELPCPQNPFQKYLRFPPAKTLGDRDWPKISYGVYAPEPRWRVCPDTTDPQQFGKDHTEDLIKKATGKWRMKGVRPNDDPKSNAQTHKPPLGYDYSVGLGALRWTFDEGKKDAWKGLNRDQLHEYAFRCLWETTQRQTYRRQIEKDIRSGPFREGVRNAASPMPPLPSAPKEGNFPGFKNNEVGTTSPEKNYQTWHLGDGYQRDSLAIRAGWMPEEQHPITRRMFEFRRQQILNAKDPDSEDYEDTSSDSDSKGSPTSENPPLSREIDPEKLEAPAPSEKQKSSTPTGDEGKSARIGKDPPFSFGDGKYESPDPMDIEDPNETVKIKETEVPEKPKKSLGTELPEVENPMDIDEPADLGEAGKTWVRYQSDHARHSCRGPPSLKPINIPPKLNKPAKSDGKGKATKRAAGGNATESDADDEGSTAPVSEEDKITIPAHLYELLYQSPHEATSFHLACQKICNDPKQRQKYFPVANEVRRIRQWAGSELPEDIEKGVEKQLPSSYTTKRAFGPSKVALGHGAGSSGAKSSRAGKKDATISGRVTKSEKAKS